MIAVYAAGGFALLVGGMILVARRAAAEYDAMMIAASAQNTVQQARVL